MELPYSNVIKGNATCRGRGGWAWAGWWGGAGGDLWERRAPWPQTKNREAIAQQAQAKTMPRGNVWPGKFGKCLGSLEGVWGRASVSARPRHSSWPLRRSGLPPAELRPRHAHPARHHRAREQNYGRHAPMLGSAKMLTKLRRPKRQVKNQTLLCVALINSFSNSMEI